MPEDMRTPQVSTSLDLIQEGNLGSHKGCRESSTGEKGSSFLPMPHGGLGRQ